MFHNEKYTLKMEDDSGEVNYKIGNPDAFDIESLPALLAIPDINNNVAQAFISMRKGRDHLVSLLDDSTEEIYDDII